MDNVDAFRDAIRAAGFEPPSEVVPGKWHRFSVNGKRTDTAGYCMMFHDMRGGIFGDWRQGVEHTWQSEAREELTVEERKAHRKAIEQAKREREAEQARVRQEARDKAQRIWDSSEPANDNHPYLVRKGVKAYGLKQSRDALVVPIKDMTGTIHSLQFIDGEGNKRFLTGGAIAGHFAGIGKLNGVMHVAEGYATAASIHQATGDAVAIAFNAGNLEPVAKAVRERFPDVEIRICADNDVNTPGNPGMTKAHKAAQAVQATVIAPEAGDFNDMMLEHGIEAVANVVTAPVVVANDNKALVDYYAPLPICDGRGKPMDIIENLAEITRRLGVTIRYNVIKKEDEILIPGKAFSVDNAANASLAWLRSECVRFRYPTGALGDYVTYLADQNLHNPVINWIQSKPWDGVSRLQDLYDTIEAEDQALKEVLIKRWMISAVAAAFRHDGVSAHGVLTLQGSQYLGKTKWFKSLVPEDLGLLKDGMLLQPHDKDSVKQVCSFWLVELGELDATFRKSDIAALKSFITNQSDVLRRPFARKESHFARRTVFFASVNPKQFLHDATGNRRYWTIEAKWIDHSHKLNMQQIWAEVLFLYNSGEPYYLQPDEMDKLNKSNEEYTVIDPVQERLESRLDWKSPPMTWTWRSATDILIEVGMDKPTVPDVNKAATFIRQKNGDQGKRTYKGRVLLAPPKITNSW
jgi:putative DNA primase/helicase